MGAYLAGGRLFGGWAPLLLGAVISCSPLSNARAKTVSAGFDIIYDIGNEKIIKVSDFPDTEDFRAQDGGLIDAGYIYKQFRIFWVPVWNYDGRWCGLTRDAAKYYEIDKPTLDAIAKEAGISLPEEPSLPFWDAYGGKLVVGIGLLTLLTFQWANRRTSSQATAEETSDNLDAKVARSGPLPPADPQLPPMVVFVARGGENIGQFAVTDIKKQVADGTLGLDDY